MRILVAFCLVVCSHPGAFAQCRAPHYHAAYALVDSSSEFIGSISIPLRDFAPARLVCLAASLKERYRAGCGRAPLSTGNRQPVPDRVAGSRLSL